MKKEEGKTEARKRKWRSKKHKVMGNPRQKVIKHGKMIDSRVTLWDLLRKCCGLYTSSLLNYASIKFVGSSRFAHVNASKRKVGLIFYLPITEHLLCNITIRKMHKRKKNSQKT